MSIILPLSLVSLTKMLAPYESLKTLYLKAQQLAACNYLALRGISPLSRVMLPVNRKRDIIHLSQITGVGHYPVNWCMQVMEGLVSHGHQYSCRTPLPTVTVQCQFWSQMDGLPCELLIPGNTTVYEFNLFEFGSWYYGKPLVSRTTLGTETARVPFRNILHGIPRHMALFR